MIYIAHRGNLSGPNTKEENKPEYLKKALDSGFNIETDVWYIENEFYLGHDKPDYKIDISFLENDKIWVHCKNLEALLKLKDNNKINCFFHNKDDFVLTSKKKIFTCPGKKLTKESICVMPEWYKEQNIDNIKKCYGICTDYVYKYKNIIDK